MQRQQWLGRAQTGACVQETLGQKFVASTSQITLTAGEAGVLVVPFDSWGKMHDLPELSGRMSGEARIPLRWIAQSSYSNLCIY